MGKSLALIGMKLADHEFFMQKTYGITNRYTNLLPAYRDGQNGCFTLIPCSVDADGPQCPHQIVEQLCANVGIIDIEPVSAMLYGQYRPCGPALRNMNIKALPCQSLVVDSCVSPPFHRHAPQGSLRLL